MKKKLYKIINEEISKFDFLRINERNTNSELIEIVNDTVFQKQFICDYLNNSEKIKIIEISENILKVEETEDNGVLVDVQYAEKIKYTYDSNEKPIELELELYGDNIFLNIVKYGLDEKLNVDWMLFDINVYLDGETLGFEELDRIPNNTYNMLCKKMGYSFIGSGVNMDITDTVNYPPTA